MREEVYDNIRKLVRTTFTDKISDCISCLPINWKPEYESDTDRDVEINMWPISRNSIWTTYRLNGRPLVWLFTTHIYKMNPLTDALHYTFVAQFHVYYSSLDAETQIDHIYQLRMHMYNNPTIRILVPELKLCRGVKPDILPLSRTIYLFTGAITEFVESMCRIFMIDSENAQRNVANSALHFIDSIDGILRMTDPDIYEYDVLHRALIQLENDFASEDPSRFREATKLVKAAASDFSGCYRTCIVLSEYIPTNHEKVLYSKPLTYKGNNKEEYYITPVHIERARKSYKQHRPRREF